MSKPLRIGQVLIDHGVLNEQQVFEICQAQKRCRLPFGVLAERMFEVTVESIEKAWIEQYHRFTGTLDLAGEPVDEGVLSLIHRRQAWQFQILPVRFERDGELLVAASRERLARAVTFAAAQIEWPSFFRIAEPEQLREHLRRYYPMPEVSPAILERARAMSVTTG